ncbi:MAG TPA: acyl carrier protein [Alphaproteobacteria bacterium]|jgi:acyl carrier protein|nr:acyl carrier protein [Alphaproteobacteria bacterium]
MSEHGSGTDERIKAIVLEVLGSIAPEIDAGAIDPQASFRDQLDIDSMDFLNFIIALHERLKVEIPETDYPRLSSLAGCVAYLQAKQLA